jgi:hypothetical protein
LKRPKLLQQRVSEVRDYLSLGELSVTLAGFWR